MARARGTNSNLADAPGFDEAVSLDTEAEEGKKPTKAKKTVMYNATLTSGRVYYYENLRFESGKAQKVDEDTKKYLEENAYLIGENKVGNKIKQFKQPRFEFKKV